MRKLVAIAACLSLAGAAPAQAQHASRADQARALRIAHRFWHRWPSCGKPVVRWTHTGGYSAEVAGTCLIEFDLGSWDFTERTRDFGQGIGISSGSSGAGWQAFCTAMIHEVGHLVLGPTYFAAVNPADPAHSPNPRSVMYFWQTHYARVCTR